MSIRPLPAYCLAALWVACGAPEAQHADEDPAEPIPAERIEGDTLRADTMVESATEQVLVLPLKYTSDWSQPSLDRWDPELERSYRDSTGDVRERRVDLDGDGLTDAAYFLRHRSAQSAGERGDAYAVVVVFGAGGDTLLGTFSWAEAMGTIGAGLRRYPSGTIHHLGSEEEDIGSPLVLEHSALSLRYFEKSEVTWFWRDGGFHRVWTAD